MMREKIMFKTILYSFQELSFYKWYSTAHRAESEIQPGSSTFLPSDIKQVLNQIHSG